MWKDNDCRGVLDLGYLLQQPRSYSSSTECIERGNTPLLTLSLELLFSVAHYFKILWESISVTFHLVSVFCITDEKTTVKCFSEHYVPKSRKKAKHIHF